MFHVHHNPSSYSSSYIELDQELESFWIMKYFQRIYTMLLMKIATSKIDKYDFMNISLN